MPRTVSPPQVVIAALDSVVSAFTAIRQQMRALEAAEMLTLAGAEHVTDALIASGMTPQLAHRMLEMELATAARESEHAVITRTHTAVTVVSEYPAVYAALADGTLSAAHARVIADAGTIITSPQERARYETAVLDIAQRETAARLKPLARHLAEQHTKDHTIEQRHREACKRRSVVVLDAGDGMADLIARLPAAYAYGIKDRLDQIARHIKYPTHTPDPSARSTDSTGNTPGPDTAGPGSAAGAENTQGTDGAAAAGATAAGGSAFTAGTTPGDTEHHQPDPRSMDMLRADILTDLLLTSPPTPPTLTEHTMGVPGTPPRMFTARVHVIVPIDTLDPDTTTPLATLPATLEGYGPIDPDTARDIAKHEPTWERVTVNPHGNIIRVNTYRPTAHLRKFLGARDLHCRFTGCRTPIRKCDIDHTIPAAHGGPTTSTNTGHLCRRHHTAKHALPWTVTQNAHGDYTWHSPTRRTHTDTPESRVRFRPVPNNSGDSGDSSDSSDSSDSPANHAHNKKPKHPF